jgi:hypothetical protein
MRQEHRILPTDAPQAVPASFTASAPEVGTDLGGAARRHAAPSCTATGSCCRTGPATPPCASPSSTCRSSSSSWSTTDHRRQREITAHPDERQALVSGDSQLGTPEPQRCTAGTSRPRQSRHTPAARSRQRRGSARRTARSATAADAWTPDTGSARRHVTSSGGTISRRCSCLRPWMSDAVICACGAGAGRENPAG